MTSQLPDSIAAQAIKELADDMSNQYEHAALNIEDTTKQLRILRMVVNDLDDAYKDAQLIGVPDKEPTDSELVDEIRQHLSNFWSAINENPHWLGGPSERRMLQIQMNRVISALGRQTGSKLTPIGEVNER